MFLFSPMTLALPLMLVLSGVHAEPPDHAGPRHAPADRARDNSPPRRAPLQHLPNEDRSGRGAWTPAPDAPSWTPGRGSHFTPEHQERARGYFDMPEHRGVVPRGWTGRGGLPPGQAKKWRIGQPLPRELVFYDLPRPLEIHLGPPPPGARYVRVASDILLIAIGTGIVIDALEDMAR